MSGHSNSFYNKCWKNDKGQFFPKKGTDNMHRLIMTHCALNDCAYLHPTYDEISQELKRINANFVYRILEMA